MVQHYFLKNQKNPLTNSPPYDILSKSANVKRFHRGVAQFGRALRSGRRGRKFESCHLDHMKATQFREKSRVRGFLFCKKSRHWKKSSDGFFMSCT